MALNFKLAEIILESKPDRFWKILKQIGVNDAVGVLPRNYNDWRNSTEDEPWDYYPMMKYRNMLQESVMPLYLLLFNSNSLSYDSIEFIILSIPLKFSMGGSSGCIASFNRIIPYNNSNYTDYILLGKGKPE